jgi:hypothetical protein
MKSTDGTMRLGKVMEIVIWIAGLGVLAANVLLLRQNRRLQDTLAPQVAAGAHFERLAGLTLDGRFQPLRMPVADSKLPAYHFFSRLSGLSGKSTGVDEAGRRVGTERRSRHLVEP